MFKNTLKRQQTQPLSKAAFSSTMHYSNALQLLPISAHKTGDSKSLLSDPHIQSTHPIISNDTSQACTGTSIQIKAKMEYGHRRALSLSQKQPAAPTTLSSSCRLSTK